MSTPSAVAIEGQKPMSQTLEQASPTHFERSKSSSLTIHDQSEQEIQVKEIDESADKIIQDIKSLDEAKEKLLIKLDHLQGKTAKEELDKDTKDTKPSKPDEAKKSIKLEIDDTKYQYGAGSSQTSQSTTQPRKLSKFISTLTIPSGSVFLENGQVLLANGFIISVASTPMKARISIPEGSLFLQNGLVLLRNNYILFPGGKVRQAGGILCSTKDGVAIAENNLTDDTNPSKGQRPSSMEKNASTTSKPATTIPPPSTKTSAAPPKKDGFSVLGIKSGKKKVSHQRKDCVTCGFVVDAAWKDASNPRRNYCPKCENIRDEPPGGRSDRPNNKRKIDAV